MTFLFIILYESLVLKLLGLKGVLHFHESTSFSGVKDLDPLNLATNHMCAIVSRLEAPNRLDVWHIDRSDKPIDLQLQYNYGEYSMI